MAEKTLQKVKKELATCSICLDTYTNPKLLQCFHVYCQGCLARLVFRDRQGQLVLICPNCRQVTSVPTGRVADLQSAFHINHLLGIIEEHSKTEDQSPHSENSTNATQYCFQHSGEEPKLFCNSCGILICFKCAIKGGEHQDHEYELIDMASKKFKEEISSSLRSVEEQMADSRQVIQELNSSQGEIFDQQSAIASQIHKSIQQVKATLDIRETQLVSQLHQITQDKLKSLSAQREKLETAQAQLGSCADFMKRSIEMESHHSVVLNMKTIMTKQADELLAVHGQPDLKMPCTQADMVYSDSADTIADCQSFGRLSGPSFPDLSKCQAIGYNLEIASLKEKAIVTMHAVDHRGKPCSQRIASVECQLISELAKNRVVGWVERVERSKYEISYQPTIKGRHSLHIKVDSQHIRGSPFSVIVLETSIHKIGSFVNLVPEVNGPHSIAFNRRRELIISGMQDNYLHLISPQENKHLSLPSNGLFNLPMGVAVDREGNIILVDAGNHRILRLTADGKVMKPSKGRKELLFRKPSGIAVNPINDKVYITEGYHHQVHILNSDLTLLSSFGSHGNGHGQFESPQAITCDSAGNVYVTDSHRVQVFDAMMNILRTFGKYGHSEGELNSPSGIAVDGNGLVYVSEASNHRVSVFTPKGLFVKVFGEHELKHPHGIAVDSRKIYVCDTDNNRIQIYS